MPIFVDSNVLVYARDASEPGKQPRASEWMTYLWESRSGRLSVQVLEEFYVVATRKLDPGLPIGEARRDVEALHAWRPLALDHLLVSDAFAGEDRFSLSFWDSLVVSAARRCRCEVLLSEDLADGENYGGVVALNPFTHRPGEVRFQVS